MTAGSIAYSAVVLAAGMSSRMQGRNKLLLPAGAEPVIRRTVRNVLEARPQEAVVVTGWHAAAVGEALAGLPVRLQANPRFTEGQMTSVAAGVAALAQPTDAVMICLGDMVLLEAADYRELADAFAGIGDRSILVPRYEGRRGNPVVFAAWRVPDIVAGRSNPGCRQLISEHPEEVFTYEATHDRFVTDMDTPADYADILARLGLSVAPMVKAG